MPMFPFLSAPSPPSMMQPGMMMGGPGAWSLEQHAAAAAAAAAMSATLMYNPMGLGLIMMPPAMFPPTMMPQAAAAGGWWCVCGAP